MKQYTHKEFVKVLKNNGFSFNRSSGSHSIYTNDKGNHISIPQTLACVIARRLIKENLKDILKIRKMTEKTA